MQLIAHHGAHANQLVPVPEQLPQVRLGRRGNPDAGEAIGQQQIQNQRRVALIGLLLPYSAGSNLRRVTDPQLVSQFRQQTLKPLDRSSGFDPHADRTGQAAVEGVSLAVLVFQPPLDQLSGGLV